MVRDNLKQARGNLRQARGSLGKRSTGRTVAVRRQILDIGGSYAITIPGDWVRRQSLDVGSEVIVIAVNDYLKVVPIPEL